MRGRLSATLPLVFLAGLVACKSDGDPLTAQTYCAEKAKRECTRVHALCAWPDEGASCEATRTAICASEAPVAGRVFNAGNAEACLAKVDATYAAPITATSWAALAEVCGRVYEGTAALGAACTANADCASPNVCDPAVKLCGPAKTLGPGALCNDPGSECPANEYCAPLETNPSVRQCRARPGMAMACSTSVPCAPALRCEGNVCVARLGTGQACLANADCTSGLCDPWSRVCVQQLAFAPGSRSCDAYRGTPLGDAAVGQ